MRVLTQSPPGILMMPQEGSFPEKTLIEGRQILDRIASNASFIAESEPSQEECIPEQESIPETESEPSSPKSIDSAHEPRPEPLTSEEKAVQPPESLFKFEDDIFDDYGNTQNYECRGKPSTSVSPPDPIEIAFLRDNVRELTAIMTQQWSRELELSAETL